MVVSLLGADWDTEQSLPGYSWKRLAVGRRLDGELLGASLYELAPGEKSFPYHFHHANEEVLIVLDGRPTLRDPDGERELAAGDAVLFRRGPEGAHQLRNGSDRPARFLMLSTLIQPEVAEYPDSGKIGTLTATAGTRSAHVFRTGDEAGYFDDEA